MLLTTLTKGQAIWLETTWLGDSSLFGFEPIWSSSLICYHLAFLCLNFPINQMGIKTIITSQDTIVCLKENLCKVSTSTKHSSIILREYYHNYYYYYFTKTTFQLNITSYSSYSADMFWRLERTQYFNDFKILIFSHFYISAIGMKFRIHYVL